MSDLVPEASGSSAVFAGNFTPAIFQPAWFAKCDLMSIDESNAAVIDVIHPEITQFSTERVTIHVTTEQLVIASKPDAIKDHVRDLALGIFYLLEHTPLTAMGINAMMHFQLSSEDAWHRLGDRLTPKSIWQEVLPERPGMESLKISSEVKSCGPGTKLNIKVEPSRLVKHGAYFEVNNHFQPQKVSEAVQEFQTLLKERWSELQDDAAKIANRIILWSSENE